MKNFSIILLGALAMLMAGCSKDVHTASTPDDDWQSNVNLPVPIQLGQGGLATKADPINTNEQLQNLTFGVFAVDKSAETWTTDDNSIYLNNEQSYVKDGYIQFGTSGTAKTIYYPLVSKENFSFYAYYNRISNNNVENTGTQILIPCTIGHTDILWACAEAQTYVDADAQAYDGYNARYVRKVTKEGQNDMLPKFEFQHVTASLEFSAIKKRADGSANTADQTIIVKSLTLNDLPTSADLCVADLSGDNKGKLIPSDAVSNIVKGLDKEVLNAAKLAEASLDKTSLCTMFICPQENERITGELTVSVDGTSQILPITLDLSDFKMEDGTQANTSGFAAGHLYRVLFTIYEAEKISIQVTLKDYVDEFDNDYIIE